MDSNTNICLPNFFTTRSRTSPNFIRVSLFFSNRSLEPFEYSSAKIFIIISGNESPSAANTLIAFK